MRFIDNPKEMIKFILGYAPKVEMVYNGEEITLLAGFDRLPAKVAATEYEDILVMTIVTSPCKFSAKYTYNTNMKQTGLGARYSYFDERNCSFEFHSNGWSKDDAEDFLMMLKLSVPAKC